MNSRFMLKKKKENTMQNIVFLNTLNFYLGPSKFEPPQYMIFLKVHDEFLKNIEEIAFFY